MTGPVLYAHDWAGRRSLLTSAGLAVFVLMQATKGSGPAGKGGLSSNGSSHKAKQRVSDGGCDDGSSVR